MCPFLYCLVIQGFVSLVLGQLFQGQGRNLLVYFSFYVLERSDLAVTLFVFLG